MGFSEHKHLPRYMYIGYVHGYCQIMHMVKRETGKYPIHEQKWNT